MPETGAVAAQADLDLGRLNAWLRTAAPSLGDVVEAVKFAGGQSNPTYRLGTTTGACVLRRKPFGPLLPTAHAVEREFRVISALHGAGFPVPRPIALCEDTAVLGAAFYLMGYARGRNLQDGAIPGAAPAERGKLYRAMTATLARLHSFSPDEAGLADYGKPGNYMVRQVTRWARQYRESELPPIAEMDALIDWLPASIPKQAHVAIVHGDFRIDNLIFAGDRAEVIAVLDWELSTLGDPIADFAYFLMNWEMGTEIAASGLKDLDLARLGIPSRTEMVAHYEALTGRPLPAQLDWYLAFNLFRLAAISHGIAGRVRAGTASSANAHLRADKTIGLARAAWRIARQGN